MPCVRAGLSLPNQNRESSPVMLDCLDMTEATDAMPWAAVRPSVGLLQQNRPRLQRRPASLGRFGGQPSRGLQSGMTDGAAP